MANSRPADAAPAAAPTLPELSQFQRNISEYLRASYQMLLVPTAEESRVEGDLITVAQQVHGMPLIFWDSFEGFTLPLAGNDGEGRRQRSELAARNTADKIVGKEQFRDPAAALRALIDPQLLHEKFNGVFVFRDLDDFFGNPVIRRTLRSLSESLRLVNEDWKRPLIITSPQLNIHPKLKTCLTVVEFSLPTELELANHVDYLHRSATTKNRERTELSPAMRDQVISELCGLTSTEAENCLARCIVRHGGFEPAMLATIKDEKAGIIKKNQVLTYVDEAKITPRAEIGGYDKLFEFVDRRKLAYTKAARQHNLDYPKGLILIGLPGTAKSVAAETIGLILGMPVFNFDVSAIFGSLVGESETRLRETIQQIEAHRGAVVVVDEADKAWGGAANSQGDSGVTRRAFGTFLTWLARKKDRTFPIMTLNRTDGLPPELLRAGRFDAIFYTDLPGPAAREEIIKIHLRKRSVDPTSLDIGKTEWEMLQEKTDGFVGSELESLVVEARATAFEQRQSGTPTFEDMVLATGSIVPLSTMDSEGVDRIREFCNKRARPVGEVYQQMNKGGRRVRTVDVTR